MSRRNVPGRAPCVRSAVRLPGLEAACAGRAGWAWPRFLPGGAAGVPGVKTRPQAAASAVRSSLEAGGAAPYDARRLPGKAAAAKPPPSGCLSQDFLQCPGRGLPAEGLAGPGVQLGGDCLQVLAAVGRQVGALGEVLAQQPVGVLVAAALPGRVRVAEVDGQPG